MHSIITGYTHIKSTKPDLAWVSLKTVNEVKKCLRCFCKHERFRNIVIQYQQHSIYTVEFEFENKTSWANIINFLRP